MAAICTMRMSKLCTCFRSKAHQMQQGLLNASRRLQRSRYWVAPGHFSSGVPVHNADTQVSYLLAENLLLILWHVHQFIFKGAAEGDDGLPPMVFHPVKHLHPHEVKVKGASGSAGWICNMGGLAAWHPACCLQQNLCICNHVSAG